MARALTHVANSLASEQAYLSLKHAHCGDNDDIGLLCRVRRSNHLIMSVEAMRLAHGKYIVCLSLFRGNDGAADTVSHSPCEMENRSIYGPLTGK